MKSYQNVKALPTIKGKIVDQQEEPVRNAVVRVVQYNGETRYRIADDQGDFSLQIERFDVEETWERSDWITLSAFDMASEQCCFQQVDVSRPEGYSDITIQLNAHPAEWLMEQYRAISERGFESMLKQAGIDKEKLEDGPYASIEIENRGLISRKPVHR